ncbi:MAG: oxidoreductase domain protein [Phycisphaerales bacterium]|jgi:predicted dehydrogenase|nr:oxidoreductase domain protein [Phycisphaerales bacterium]
MALETQPEPAPHPPRLRAAVIGTGKISEEHLRFLGADPHVTLAAVCDLSPSLAKYAVARFGAQQAFTDSSQMLADARPDVVHVLTPPHTHAKLVTDALTSGAHVIVEKPVAPSNREFRDLWSLAQSRGRRIVEDHNYRFNEPVLAIEKLVAERELGDVREVDVRMALGVRKPGGRYMDENLPHPSHRMPAGVIHEFITHLCYLALRFLPSFERVAAAWSKHGNDALFKHDDLDALVIGGPVHARIRFTSHAAPDCFSLTVRGTRGWAETDLFQPHLRVVVPRKGGQQLSPLLNHWMNGAGMMRASLSGFRNKVLQKTPYEGLRTFLDRTYTALRAGDEPPVTYDDMDRASRLVDAMLDESNRV